MFTIFRYGCSHLGGQRPSLAACPRLLSVDTGHQALRPMDLGHAVGNFRHPRARIASYCRRGDQHKLQSEHDFLRCTAYHVSSRPRSRDLPLAPQVCHSQVLTTRPPLVPPQIFQRHLGVMTRLILGIALPGVGNGIERLEPLAPTPAAEGRMLRSALLRLRDGFAFVGITEAWSESVHAFHRHFMPSGSTVTDEELYGEGHYPSTTPPRNESRRLLVPAMMRYLETEYDILHSNEVAVDLRYDEKWFPEAWQREVLSKDADLVIFAHARLAFCRQFARFGPLSVRGVVHHVPLGSHAASPPAVCVKSLGPLVHGSPSEQKSWARHLLLEHWAGEVTMDIGYPPLNAVIESLAGEDVSRLEF